MKSILDDTPYSILLGFQEEVIRLVEQKFIKNKVVLDVGCGYGWWESIGLKKGVKKIIGIDVSEEGLNIARKIKNKKIEFRKASALDIPNQENSFDTVVSWEVLEHIPKNTEGIMFKEVFRVLKSGGYLFLSTQYNNFFSDILDPAWWLTSHRHYSKDQIIEFANEAGFKIEKIYVKGGFFTILNSLNTYIAKWIFRRFPFFEEFFIQKTQNEYKREKGIMNIFMKCYKEK